jgi:hypothetical protein
MTCQQHISWYSVNQDANKRISVLSEIAYFRIKFDI